MLNEGVFFDEVRVLQVCGGGVDVVSSQGVVDSLDGVTCGEYGG